MNSLIYKKNMKEYLKILLNFLKKFYPLIIIAAIFLIVVYIFKLPACPIRILTGFPCPSCGMTRAGFEVLKLNFIEAFNYNPCIFLIPLILWVLIFKERPIIKKIYYSKIFWISLIIVVLTTYIIRLIYIYPNYPLNYDPNNIISYIVNFIKNIF